jgi:sialate O-acetylesterase
MTETNTRGSGRPAVDIRTIALDELTSSRVLPRDATDRAFVQLPPGATGTVVHEDGASPLVAASGVVELATGGPYRLVARLADGSERVVDDLLVGDLWALAGQSNMAGAGELTPPPTLVERARMLSFDGRWKAAVEPLHRLWEDADNPVTDAARRYFHPTLSDDEWHAVIAGARGNDADGPRVGPGAAFARALSNETGVPIGLLPCALGATSLDLWMPDVEPDRPRDETLYGNLVHRVRRFGPVRGVLWHQGEGDTGVGLGDKYAERFRSFVDHLRNDLGDAGLPVVAAQIGRYDLDQLKRVLDLDVDPAIVPGWPAVRDAMRCVADTVPNVSVVATADLTMIDGIHLDRNGQERLGLRFATVAAQYVPGATFGRPSPRLASVERTADGRGIVCAFTDIADRLRLSGVCDVLVEPGGHLTSVVEPVDRDRIVVHLDAPIPGGATVTYGPGLNPRAGLVDGVLAVPLFGPVPVK